ncbi:hypothetical protein KJY73_01070 [Bowmanella sp. Y26]|uniref:hypothetical protein n=1 Tax=Bowmanella yangjiangensis TaxID=2811230 RepID=UPI001BDC9387|nr:hypothetical protein [Bowmanella yangjiangensis]MBT1062136.1 hypothetical protein [Bowmanella yangjiangensis]
MKCLLTGLLLSALPFFSVAENMTSDVSAYKQELMQEIINQFQDDGTFTQLAQCTNQRAERLKDHFVQTLDKCLDTPDASEEALNQCLYVGVGKLSGIPAQKLRTCVESTAENDNQDKLEHIEKQIAELEDQLNLLSEKDDLNEADLKREAALQSKLDSLYIKLDAEEQARGRRSEQ